MEVYYIDIELTSIAENKLIANNKFIISYVVELLSQKDEWRIFHTR